MARRDDQMPLATEREIQQSYREPLAAQRYVQNRFASELMALLHERQVAAVNRVMGVAKPQRTLEVAPGPGRVTRDVRPAGELVCLEFNEGMIAEGRRCCGDDVRWIRGNAFELPFQDGEFDFAYSFRFVRHFHRDDRSRLYAELRRVLQPEGLLVLDAVNARVSGPLREANPEAYPIYDKLYRNEAELRQELAEAGFDTLSIEPVQRWFSLQYKAQVLLGPRSRRLCRWTIRTLEHLRRGPALEWIVTARTPSLPLTPALSRQGERKIC
ncbi:MAG: methyltransferase domain-containing protein [Planctomycetia bacterium]|nr:methyltransferase domain-containing protein [Planctomycetia bacterium]